MAFVTYFAYIIPTLERGLLEVFRISLVSTEISFDFDAYHIPSKMLTWNTEGQN